MTAVIVKETLIALFKDLYKSMALFGCGLAGIALTIQDLKDL
jgi:hypothetical protein